MSSKDSYSLVDGAEGDISRSIDKTFSKSGERDRSPVLDGKPPFNVTPLGSLGTGGSMSSFATSTSRPASGAAAKRRPWEQKETVRCMFCRGAKCRRCGKDAYQLCENSPIQKIHANWITEDILAMQRPADEHFVRHKFVEQLKDLNIVAVFNLQEPGEHPFCGFGTKESGFSYYPEKLMAAGVKFFNYSWKDMTTPPIAMMMDIVRIALNEINNGGKVAVHCHAGFGRTGIVIASIMMAQHRYDAEYTINVIREKRPGSVQTTQQQVFVYEFKAAYTQMEEFYPPCTFGGGDLCFDKNMISTFKTIAVSEKDQHYCLSPTEAVKYAKCPKSVALAIDLLKTASVLSAALTSCFIIGLHPNLVVKADSFNPNAPLYMPPLEPEELVPVHATVAVVPQKSKSNSPIEIASDPPDESVPADDKAPTHQVTASLDSGLAVLADLEASPGTSSSPPPRSGKTRVVKNSLEHTLAYRVAHARHAISTLEWISEDVLELFKADANLGDWTRWSPPKTTLATSTPTQAAQQNMGISKLSQTIENIKTSPRKTPTVTPRCILPSPSPDQAISGLHMPLSPDANPGPPSLESVPRGQDAVEKNGDVDGGVTLPPLSSSSKSKIMAVGLDRRLSKDGFGASLPRISIKSPMKDGTPLLTERNPEMFGHGRSKSFSSFKQLFEEVHVQPQEKVADDHVTEALVKEELVARERLQSLKISLKRPERKNSNPELQEYPLVENSDGDTKRRKSLDSITSGVALSSAASGYLEMVQALGDEHANLDHEANFFLGGILLVDWLESRADPLLDNSVLEMLSDAWCKSMSTKPSTESSKDSTSEKVARSAEFQPTPCTTVKEADPSPPLASQGKSTSFLGGLVGSLSPDRSKGRKTSSKSRKSPLTLGRGSTYASFGVEGEPVTAKILDDLLKKHMPRYSLLIVTIVPLILISMCRHKLKTLQYIVTAMTALYRSSVDTVVDKELTRCAIMRIAIACTLVVRRCPSLVVNR